MIGLKRRPETKFKLLVIVLSPNLGEEYPYYAQSPSPPLPGILLAAMTPPIIEVEVLHEMVRPINYSTNAHFVALSFLDYLAPHAYEVADKFRSLGKIVIAGGRFPSTHPDEVQPHFHSILIGEAQHVWPQMVQDMVKGNLQPRYIADAAPSLANIPPPRYDLAESKFAVPIVTEASRGCPHGCTYCALNINRTPHRRRPVSDVIRDLTSVRQLPWHKRKMAMLLDNNLGGDLIWAKELLGEIAKLSFWGIGVQFSIDCLRDDEFVDLLEQAHTRMAFIGMESLNESSLAGIQKYQNKIAEYGEAFLKLHQRGILTFTGFMFALDADTAEYYATLPFRLDATGACIILPSIAIPIYGTPLWQQMTTEKRIVDFDLSHYEGDHLVFHHPYLTDSQVYDAYRSVNRLFFSYGNILRRWLRFVLLQRKREPILQFGLKLLISTLVYFKLSLFQRHHARSRVLVSPQTKRERAADRHAPAEKKRRASPTDICKPVTCASFRLFNKDASARICGQKATDSREGAP